MQNATVQFQKYPPTQGHLIVYDSVFLLSYHHSARIIVQHRLERQETPQDPVPGEIVSCSWNRDPTKTWHSVPEGELCPGALLCNAANSDAGVTSAGTYIINQLVCTY